jgi:hypothetical protein
MGKVRLACPVFREETMVRRHWKLTGLLPALSILWLGLAPQSVGAQCRLFDRLFGRSYEPQPCPVAPFPPAVPAEQARPEAAPTPEQPRPEAAPTSEQPSSQPEPSFQGGQAFALGGSTINMLGDIFVPLGLPSLAFLNRGAPGFPPLPGSRPFSPIAVPSVRTFEISENESPRPQDRIYFGFNYFDNVNKSVDERLQSDLHRLRVYRETFGFEKTFLDQNASIGMRLPLNTLTSESDIPGLGTDDTSLGDLSIILKYAFWQDRSSGSLLSGGMAITVPTGPETFAGSHAIVNIHETILQPYVGYYLALGNGYFHGFSAIDVPTDERDVTLLHNDIGVGYFLYRSPSACRLLTAVIPTFEAHVNDPLNHRGAFNFADPAGTADWVDLTSGVTFEFRRRATLAVALVTPVTGPKPFDFEVLAQLNVRFGGGSRYGVLGP